MTTKNVPATATKLLFPADDREGQCVRAANYMEAHPGCGLRELADGADLGSASKVISEMPRFGYVIRREWGRIPCVDGMHFRREVRYWLHGRPQTTQASLF